MDNNRKNKVLYLLSQNTTIRKTAKFTHMNRLHVTHLYSKLSVAHTLGINVSDISSDNIDETIDILMVSKLIGTDNMQALRILLAFLPELRKKLKVRVRQLHNISDTELKIQAIEYISTQGSLTP